METEVKGTKKLFDGQSIYVGIDCHKKNWTVTILGEQYEHKTMSQNPDPDILASYLKRNFPGAQYNAVYEAGFNGFYSCRRLKELGVNCNVIHAADVPTSNKEKIQKIDPVDSRKLARSLRSKEFESINIPEPSLEADRTLVRQRFRVMKDVTRTKARVRSLLFQFNISVPDRFTRGQTRSWSKIYINWLKELQIEYESLKHTLDNYIRIGELQRKELLTVNRQLRSLSQTDAYRGNYNLLISIPGIGFLTSMTFLAQIGDIRRFKLLDDLCDYIGLVPMMHGSGDKMYTGKLINRGRKELKIMIIEASWDAVRLDPALMAKFNVLTRRMNKNKAIIRIARKLVSRMRYVLMNQEPYKLGLTE
jgi:transposase